MLLASYPQTVRNPSQMKTLYDLIKVVLLTLILMFTIHTSKAQHDLEERTALMFEQTRNYSDNRSKEAQIRMLSLLAEISSTTRRLATLQCPKDSKDGFCDPRYNPYISRGAG